MIRFLILLLPIICFAVTNPSHRRIFYHYVSGDAFRAYSDHAYDEITTDLNPSLVKPGDTIFVRIDYIKDFIEKIHPHIQSKYILITHNQDNDAPGAYKSLLDDEKLIAWFGENYDGYEHPKMIAIPMGMATCEWPNGNGDSLKKAVDENYPKEHLSHMGFTIQTNYKERWNVFKQFSQAPFVYRTIKKLFKDYVIDMAKSKFEIAPRGFAIDTYRLWECLYVGTIPVVRTSSLDKLYEGLPILIIQDWKEVTEEFLNEKYLEMSKKTYNMEKTTIKYWTDLIDTYKAKL